MDTESATTLDSLYPDLTDEELREAEDNLEQYLALVLRIHERVSSDPASYAHLHALLGTDGTVHSGTPRKESRGLPTS